jgi:predicted PurR-regulated permease PerM
MIDAPRAAQGQLEREEHAALGWAAIVATLVLVWLVLPVGIGILLGTLLAFMAQPLFHHLERRIGRRGSALATVGLSIITFAAAVGGLAWLLVDSGTRLASRLHDSFEPGGFGDGAVASIARVTVRFGVSRSELESQARDLAATTASHATDIATSIASATGSALLALLFAMLAMHFVLRNWDTVARRARETLPLRPRYTEALFAEFRAVGRTTLLGAIGTAAVQGVLATVGYAIVGVPEPMFFGAVTALASFVPGVGVLIVLIPVSAGLFLAGQPVRATVEVVWGLLLVVGLSDYVIRPRLLRGERKVPSLVTFASLFGGVEAFGLKGLITGPVLMAVAIAVLRLYAAEARARRDGDAGQALH